ncbi:MAG: phenylalanine 4-monooxygenase [Motiliproteus sp.]|nr:phenylalanine 4-monooxygenase [Motiliproteus sp.]MCW9053960.1 phenylalanine 4-monooxygenase [Motiliproteus sp.]
MKSTSSYVSRRPDKQGYVKYLKEDHAVWEKLYLRQIEVIAGRACDEYIAGVEALNLPSDHIPQIPDINRVLKASTGWGVAPVPALIGFEEFFSLLANKRFPAATFIRTEADLDYLQEPDIFHEIFGHCPLLTNPAYAAFSQRYGELGLAANKAARVMLARLYWFTIEFGLVNTPQGLRIYGGGILSSYEETQYSLDSHQPQRVPFDPVDVFRTPYRIDVLQRIYFIIQQLSDLQQLAKLDLMELIETASHLGMKPSLYPAKEQVA